MGGAPSSNPMSISKVSFYLMRYLCFCVLKPPKTFYTVWGHDPAAAAAAAAVSAAAALALAATWPPPFAAAAPPPTPSPPSPSHRLGPGVLIKKFYAINSIDLYAINHLLYTINLR